MNIPECSDSPVAAFTFPAFTSQDPALSPERLPAEKGATSLFLKVRPLVSWGFLNFSSYT